MFLGLTGDEFHPGDPQRKEVLNPAGGNTSMATGTFCQVNNHSPSHCVISFSIL
jgi:hypothetical protein